MQSIKDMFSVLFNLFKSKNNRKLEVPEPTLPNRAENTRPMLKELLDMKDLQDDVPSHFVKPTAPRENTSSRVNIPLGVDPKALAKATAARIDAIEKEMSLDLRGNDANKLLAHPRAQEIADRTGMFRVAPPANLPDDIRPTVPEPVTAHMPNYETQIVMPEFATNLILGDTSLAQIIDVKESSIAAPVEEAAVLYANGMLDESIQVLQEAFKQPEQLGSSEFNAYRTLLDLLRIKGDHATFDSVAMDFIVRFEKSPPSWVISSSIDLPLELHAVPIINLGEMLDASIIPALEQLKVLAQHSNKLRLDASSLINVNTEDGFGCELMLRVMTAFESADYELEIIGIPQLVAILRPHIKPGHSEVSGHVWLLYLALLRIVNKPELFEMRALEFATTYEISPPSWVDPSAKIKMASVEQEPQTTIMQMDRPDHIRLAGEMTGDGTELVNLLANGFVDSMVVICDCTHLTRVEFSAAAKLLTALTYWTGENKVVEFRNLNHPIAALFVTLGVHHMAVVERRRDA